jgi:hypothetical protein
VSHGPVHAPERRWLDTLRAGERHAFGRPLSVAADARIRARLRAESAPRPAPWRSAAVGVALSAVLLTAHAAGMRRVPAGAVGALAPSAAAIADIGALGPAPAALDAAFDAPPGLDDADATTDRPGGPTELP